MLKRQENKLDLLLRRGATLDKAEQSVPLNCTSAGSIDLSPPTQPLPLFESPTSPFFCISLLDKNAEDSKTTDPAHPASLDGASGRPLPPHSSFSVVQGRIIYGDSNRIVGHEDEDEDDVLTMQHETFDPLDELDGTNIIRLVHQYQGMVQHMYPVLDISLLIRKARSVFATTADDQWDKRSIDANGPQNTMGRNDIAILKMVLAIALVAEGDQYAGVASKLHHSLQQDVGAMIWKTKLDLNGLVLLVLVVRCYQNLLRHIEFLLTAFSLCRAYIISFKGNGALPGGWSTASLVSFSS